MGLHAQRTALLHLKCICRWYVTCNDASWWKSEKGFSNGMGFMSWGSMRAVFIFMRMYLSLWHHWSKRYFPFWKPLWLYHLWQWIDEGNIESLCVSLQTSTELQTPAVNHVVRLKSDNYRSGFHHHRVITDSTGRAICWIGPGQSARWVSFHYSAPLSSVILIWKVCLAIDFLHLPKAWWTAAWLDSRITHPGHLADINNQPFPSSLFGITRLYIRPNSHLLAAKLLEAQNSFSPYKEIWSVVGQE